MSAHDTAFAEFSERGYAFVADFLDPEITELAYRYGMLHFKVGGGKKCEGEHGAREEYSNSLMETLLEMSTPRMEAIVGVQLWPAYSFFRLYEKGMSFPKHRDRSSCEYSVSVCLGRDGAEDWPLFANGTPVPCPPGGGAVYRGCEVEHWREPLAGNHQLQLFLHYVDKNGVWRDVCRYDGRPMLGVPARFRHPDKVKKLKEMESEYKSHS